MKTRTLAHDDIPDTYAELVGLFMPRPLHDEVDYRNALGVLDAMAGFALNADQDDYFDAITTFVEKYDADHHALGGAKMTPVELLRRLMDEHGMNE
jgi:antitoxin component HigA of HigAB toxin-antitoxin module